MAGSARFVGTEQIEQALLAAFEEWASDDVNNEYWREEFFSRKWQYDGTTVRKNGETAGPGPRNIVDLENLYDSGVRSFRFERSADGAEAKWHWNATNSSGEEYAWFVHEGQGPHSRTARPWTDELASEWLFGMSEIKGDLMEAIDRHLNG